MCSIRGKVCWAAAILSKRMTPRRSITTHARVQRRYRPICCGSSTRLGSRKIQLEGQGVRCSGSAKSGGEEEDRSNSSLMLLQQGFLHSWLNTTGYFVAGMRRLDTQPDVRQSLPSPPLLLPPVQPPQPWLMLMASASRAVSSPLAGMMRRSVQAWGILSHTVHPWLCPPRPNGPCGATQRSPALHRAPILPCWGTPPPRSQLPCV
jgi:hypothetical protein